MEIKITVPINNPPKMKWQKITVMLHPIEYVAKNKTNPDVMNLITHQSLSNKFVFSCSHLETGFRIVTNGYSHEGALEYGIRLLESKTHQRITKKLKRAENMLRKARML